ncbi:hypothetical protein TESG_01397 [Trichophyton tonsurans CBS 112818]|uniref:Uncharacterized protein n=1 Tax=Trichophyton tonsurans (strain CBS 112818) TaxID=647933 RepID=F2RRF7_TRIT1|nr:hypothetical protein TESG_01397 [Trichophyton tonsurans CBS 112818]
MGDSRNYAVASIPGNPGKLTLKAQELVNEATSLAQAVDGIKVAVRGTVCGVAWISPADLCEIPSFNHFSSTYELTITSHTILKQLEHSSDQYDKRQAEVYCLASDIQLDTVDLAVLLCSCTICCPPSYEEAFTQRDHPHIGNKPLPANTNLDLPVSRRLLLGSRTGVIASQHTRDRASRMPLRRKAICFGSA